MWPWEHLAVGYLTFSTITALGYRRRPTGIECLLVAIGTQFPDLVDKPLAWVFGVVPTGTTLAHSVFVAVPLSAVVLIFGWRYRARGAAAAFVVGYLLHLPGDVLYRPILLGGPISPEILLWPVVAKASATTPGKLLVVSRMNQYLTLFVDALSQPSALPYLSFEGILLVSAAARWVMDGRPNPLESLIDLLGTR
jgi:hypothetical protein